MRSEVGGLGLRTLHSLWRRGGGKEGSRIWVWPFKLGRGRRLIWRDVSLQQIRAQNLEVPQRFHSIQEPCPKYVALGPYLAGTLPIPPGRHSDLADETCGPDRHSCDPAAEPRCCTPQKLWQVAPIFLSPAVVAAYSGEGICGRLHGVLPPWRAPGGYLVTWAELAKISRHLPHLGEKSDHNPQRVRKQTDLRIVYWHRAPLRRVQHVIEGGREG